MSIAFYNGALGMKAYQTAMDVTAHNIANVNTYGFKNRRASFQDLLNSRINTRVEGQHMVGHGVKVEGADLLFGQSGLDQTGFVLDFAIVGEGFFQIDNRGERQYTRNGAFDLSVEGDNALLVTNDGSYVLDRAGNRIALTKNADGTFSTDGLKERLAVYSFANPFGLNSENNSAFSVSDNSGPAVLMGQGANQKKYEIVQHALEYSAVDLGKEMVDIIASQRAFQMNGRVVQTADQLAEIVNKLR